MSIEQQTASNERDMPIGEVRWRDGEIIVWWARHAHLTPGLKLYAAQQPAVAPQAPQTPSHQEIFAWLQGKYVQRADERQKAMGLVYTEAETYDLADSLARYIASYVKGKKS